MKIYLTNLITEALKKLNYPERSFSIEYAKEKNFGDYSCNVPLILSKSLKKNPKLIAQEIVDNLEINSDTISKFEIAGAGFINIFLTNKYYKNESKRIIRENNSFGKSNINIDKTANLEWVSANPTGLLHAGHGRQICLGKAIANLLEWTGYTVTREYYYNS